MEEQLSLFRNLGFSAKPNIVYEIDPKKVYSIDDPYPFSIWYKGYPDTSFLGGKFQDISNNLIDLITLYGEPEVTPNDNNILYRSSVNIANFRLDLVVNYLFNSEGNHEDMRTISYLGKEVFKEMFYEDIDTTHISLVNYEPGEWEDEFQRLCTPWLLDNCTQLELRL